MEPSSSHTVNLSAISAFPEVNPWDVGPAVAQMQELLRAHGFQIRVDGDYGWRTETAVKSFQRQHGIRIDGIVGLETWTKLMQTLTPGSRILRYGHVGADVYELQGVLQVNGFAVKRTGMFDAETKSAVMSFQREHHLQDDGVVGAVTWALLCNQRPDLRVNSSPSLLQRLTRRRLGQ
jgi:peptidoglycan hydrolase-like protein with peptidoglycan-binding domain